MDSIAFWLVMGNLLINAVVFNEQLKHLRKLKAFVAAAKVYANAYNLMAIKYNEVASGFNEMKEVTDNQAALLEIALAYLEPLPEGLGSPTLAEKPKRASKRQSKQSTDTD